MSIVISYNAQISSPVGFNLVNDENIEKKLAQGSTFSL